jgi:Xaa-Pro aminopeptidase
MSRLARLAAGLTAPLLVTDGVNVRYLTGFESSNCALLVQPDGATTLYTDFRYAESARSVDDVEFVQTRRDVASALAELLAGRTVGFEA